MNLHRTLIALSTTVFIVACGEPLEPQPIVGDSASAPVFIGEPASPRPIAITIPPHPFMAQQGLNAMHADGYSSDVHPGGGPLGKNVQVRSRVGITGAPGGQCATLTFDAQHRLVALCAAMTGFRLHLIEPRSLRLLAEYKLPIRPSTYDSLIHRDKSYIMKTVPAPTSTLTTRTA